MLAADTAEQAATDAIGAQSLVWLKSWMELPADTPIDGALRASLEGLAADHVARMEPIFHAWAREEAGRFHGSANFSALLFQAMTTRFTNEAALWRLESPGDEYDKVMLEALQRPAYCRLWGRERDLSLPALVIQGLNAAGRATALAGERDLLSRWGRPRTALPARPVPSLREREDRLIAQARSGGDSPDPALPPVLASRLVVDPVRPLDTDMVCALHRWGLANVVKAEPARAREALVAYRYAMMPLAAEVLGSKEDAKALAGAEASGAYPPFAARYGVEGTVTLIVTTDLDGRFKKAVVVDRAITVQGLRGRPVAFETVLDGASIARAAAGTYPKPDPAPSRDGMVERRQQIHWRLE